MLAWALGRVIPLAWPGLNDFPARVIGYAFAIGGPALMAWGIAELARAKTTVRPDRGVSVLVTTGPFRYARNPIYAGDVMLLLGLAQLSLNIWFVILAVAFAFLVRRLAILPEERHLEARFGDAYRAYKDRTRRWI